MLFRFHGLTKDGGSPPKKVLKGNLDSPREIIEENDIVMQMESPSLEQRINSSPLNEILINQVLKKIAIRYLEAFFKFIFSSISNVFNFSSIKFTCNFHLFLSSLNAKFSLNCCKGLVNSAKHFFLKIKSQIPQWEEVVRDMKIGRNKLAKIWKELGLVKTAVFIENNMASDPDILQILYDRLTYMRENVSTFPTNILNKKISNQNNEWANEEDANLIEEIQEAILKDTTFVSIEGKFSPLDKFCAQLYEAINPDTLSQDFPPQNVGAGRYIVGFNRYPQIDLLTKSFYEHKVSIISINKYKEITSKDWESTSGAIFFLNGKKPLYLEIQLALAHLPPAIKDLIKRVHLRQEMGIIFVPTDKLLFFIEKVHYINIGEDSYKIVPNISPEYYKGIGKLILMNCPLDQITVVKKVLNARYNFSNDEIVKLVQIKRTKTTASITKFASYIIWFRGEDTIRKALLTVMDLAVDKKRISYFCWPIKKGEDQLPISIKIK